MPSYKVLDRFETPTVGTSFEVGGKDRPTKGMILRNGDRFWKVKDTSPIHDGCITEQPQIRTSILVEGFGNLAIGDVLEVPTIILKTYHGYRRAVIDGEGILSTMEAEKPLFDELLRQTILVNSRVRKTNHTTFVYEEDGVLKALTWNSSAAGERIIIGKGEDVVVLPIES